MGLGPITISPHDGGIAMVAIRLVRIEVYLAEELLLMVLELAHHIVGGAGAVE